MRYLAFFIFFSTISLGTAQVSDLQEMEKELALYGDILSNVEMPAHRAWAIQKFNTLFEEALTKEGSFDYPFDSVKWMLKQVPEDGAFKLYTWQEKVHQQEYIYHGFIQLRNGKVFPLKDRSASMEDIEYGVFSPNDWYGALYYNIKQFKAKKGTAYLLFGIDYYNFYNRRKVVDVITINDDQVTFGAPVFVKDNDGRRPIVKNRLMIEFAGDANVRMNYDEQLEMLVHDNLIAINNRISDMQSAYPDGSYVGYVFKKGEWNHKEKIFHQTSEEAPRPEPILDNRRKNIFGKQ